MREKPSEFGYPARRIREKPVRIRQNTPAEFEKITEKPSIEGENSAKTDRIRKILSSRIWTG